MSLAPLGKYRIKLVQLGGYMGNKSKHSPGNIIIWRGLMTCSPLTTMFRSEEQEVLRTTLTIRRAFSAILLSASAQPSSEQYVSAGHWFTVYTNAFASSECRDSVFIFSRNQISKDFSRSFVFRSRSARRCFASIPHTSPSIVYSSPIRFRASSVSADGEHGRLE